MGNYLHPSFSIPDDASPNQIGLKMATVNRRYRNI